MTIAKEVDNNHIQESIFKHDFRVKRLEQQPVKIIRFDHRKIPAPQVYFPPRLKTSLRHEFTVHRPMPPPLLTPLSTPLKVGAPSLTELLEGTFVENQQNPYLTYYGPIGASFGFVSKHHMQNLPSAGWNVYWVTLENLAKWAMAYPSETGIIHPLMFSFFTGLDFAGYKELRKTHKKLVGYEVADSDSLSTSAINLVSEVDLLMVPSETSKKAYLNSGLKTPIEVVPHGVSDLYKAPKNPLPKVPHEGVKVLFFEVHSKWRKGGDVVLDAMSKILKQRKDIQFVFRGGADNVLCKLPQTTSFSNLLSDADVVRLYDSCDILLAPSRGGAFELNVLEGLTRGLVVITSDWGAVQEYARNHVLTIRSTGKKYKPLPGNPVHVGYGTDPDPAHTYELVNYAVDNLAELKKKAESSASEFRQKYSWKNTTQKMANALSRLK